METFIQTMRAGWGDMDFNSHMRNTADFSVLPSSLK